MNWSIRLALLGFVVLSTQTVFAVGQAATPWENSQLAEDFINSFLRFIAQSGAFSPNQLDDMSSIGDTLKTAIEKMAQSRKSSKSKLQALNMAFASSMAEIAVAEQGGLSLEAKTNAIANALASAFLETTGFVNQQFVSEIKSLIYMIAQASSNEISGSAAAAGGGSGGGGGSGQGGYGQGASASASAAAAYGSAPQGAGGPAPQGPSQQGPVSQGPYGPGAAAAAAAAGGYGPGAGQQGQQGPGGARQQGPVGQGPYGPGAAAAAAAVGGYGPGAGQQGPGSGGQQGPGGQGPYGPSAAAAAAAAGPGAGRQGPGSQGPGSGGQQGPGGQGPYGPSAAAAAAAAGGYGPGAGQQGPGSQGPGSGGQQGPGSQGPGSGGQQGPGGQGPYGPSAAAAAAAAGGYGPGAGQQGPGSQGPGSGGQQGPGGQGPYGPGAAAAAAAVGGYGPGAGQQGPGSQGPGSGGQQGPGGQGPYGPSAAAAAAAAGGYGPGAGQQGPGSQGPGSGGQQGPGGQGPYGPSAAAAAAAAGGYGPGAGQHRPRWATTRTIRTRQDNKNLESGPEVWHRTRWSRTLWTSAAAARTLDITGAGQQTGSGDKVIYRPSQVGGKYHTAPGGQQTWKFRTRKWWTTRTSGQGPYGPVKRRSSSRWGYGPGAGQQGPGSQGPGVVDNKDLEVKDRKWWTTRTGGQGPYGPSGKGRAQQPWRLGPGWTTRTWSRTRKGTTGPDKADQAAGRRILLKTFEIKRKKVWTRRGAGTGPMGHHTTGAESLKSRGDMDQDWKQARSQDKVPTQGLGKDRWTRSKKPGSRPNCGQQGTRCKPYGPSSPTPRRMNGMATRTWKSPEGKPYGSWTARGGGGAGQQGPGGQGQYGPGAAAAAAVAAG
ncbi:hypothetical protein HNY73_014692 [Argiope bruennichi]|uniref:Spidroin N-terminal domain-containing protein n=1 Tax=Argiope bruennichi TaxID=94029 RepID=A0A8T0EPT4_ARGBR|nr:hypothetical protein HNY73_014692 [Argiope bruennichi]